MKSLGDPWLAYPGTAQETEAEVAMDEARKAGQVVPKYRSQAATAVARASIFGSAVPGCGTPENTTLVIVGQGRGVLFGICFMLFWELPLQMSHYHSLSPKLVVQLLMFMFL